MFLKSTESASASPLHSELPTLKIFFILIVTVITSRGRGEVAVLVMLLQNQQSLVAPSRATHLF